jgi:hypothetical protein
LKSLLTILIMCFITQFANAQMTVAYSMGVLGGDLKLSNSSNPLTLSMANCIQVSNGVTKFLITNAGMFINECIVDLNYSKISIQVLPNPFVDAVYVKFKTKIDKDNHFKISVFNNLGNLVKIENVNQDLFYTGYKVALSNIPSGIYLMQINSSKVNEVFKIFKNE